MSRDRDSQVVYELVTSKYKIAERNRLAKIRFLTTMSDSNINTISSSTRRDSEPNITQTEKAETKAVDLSVPGTPVSSRYLRSLKKLQNKYSLDTDSEDEADEPNKYTQNTMDLVKEELKQFNYNMEKLQQKTSHDQISSNEPKEEETIKKEPAVSRVEKYFQESARRGSLTRDFSEVVQTFDPKVTQENQSFAKPGTPISSSILVQPGTQISSKLIKAEKIASSVQLMLFTEDMKKLEALTSPEIVRQTSEKLKIEETTSSSTPSTPPPEKPKRMNPVPLSPTITPPSPSEFTAFPSVSSKETLDCRKNSQCCCSHCEAKISSVVKVSTIGTPIATTTKQSSQPEETQKPIEKKQNIKRSDSVSSIKSDFSVPGTPVDSRKVFKIPGANGDDSNDDSDLEIVDSEEIKALAKEFTEKIEGLTQKTASEDKKKEEKKEVEQKILIIYDKSEETSNSRVKDYFERSEKDKSYQRSFSEVENFNVPSKEVKQKVEQYFKDSEQKKSLTRGFSEAVNYVEPTNIEKLFKPGTPVSSKTVMCLKKEIIGDQITEDEEKELDPDILHGMEAFKRAHDALHPPPEFKVDDYFEDSKTRQTLKRDFSEVFGQLGTQLGPVNPEVNKFFEESDAQKSFRRQFSEAFQTLQPRVKDILIDKNNAPLHHERSSRAGSVISAPDRSDDAQHPRAQKQAKKYGVDKYFATSLYRTAYHRLNTERRGSEPNHRLVILEDEYVFGETDALRSQTFQNDDETPIRRLEGDMQDANYEQQNVQFWRDFLKPYQLNLQSDIVMRDQLIDKYAKYTLE